GAKPGLGAQELGAVRFRAAGFALIVEPGGLVHHEVRRLELHPALRERVLDALVLSDRPIEHDALVGVARGALQRDPAQADRLGGDQDALRVHAVQDVVEAAALDRKSTRLNSSHVKISYAVFCLKKKKKIKTIQYDIA